MSRPMNMTEFAAVLNHAMKNNGPFSGRRQHPVVKYIDPHIDLRSNTVFSITFRGFGGADAVLHCQNECRELPESLHDRCMKYLKGE